MGRRREVHNRLYDPATGDLIVNLDDNAILRPADVDEMSTYVLFLASDDGRTRPVRS